MFGDFPCHMKGGTGNTSSLTPLKVDLWPQFSPYNAIFALQITEKSSGQVGVNLHYGLGISCMRYFSIHIYILLRFSGAHYFKNTHRDHDFLGSCLPSETPKEVAFDWHKLSITGHQTRPPNCRVWFRTHHPVAKNKGLKKWWIYHPFLMMQSGILVGVCVLGVVAYMIT